MKNKTLFDETISVLVKAYFEGTLEHANSCGCAVGNLISTALNYEVYFHSIQSLSWSKKEPVWYHYIKTPAFLRLNCMMPEALQLAREQVESTGYSVHELDRIEKAFESYDDFADRDGFQGLMCVIDELCNIHEADSATKESTKQMFVNR